MTHYWLSSPGRIIFFSMLAAIACGTLLLSSSWAQLHPIALLDCFFTASSCVCVTGLMVVPLSSFSYMGQCVIMLLIQIGALGLLTLTIFVLSLFTTLGLSTKSVTGEALELTAGEHPKSLVAFTIFFTLMWEVIGFLVFICLFKNHYSWQKSLFYALFHSISAFSSAGLSLVPYTEPPFAGAHVYLFLAMTSLLVMIGELGFVVWRDIVTYLQALYLGKRTHLTLHTRIIFSMSSAIIVITAALFFSCEYLLSCAHENSFFYSVCNAICLRSAGFCTIPPTLLHKATLLLTIVISFIGCSPGSTGSGIKVTTCAVLLSAVFSAFCSQVDVSIKKRTIPPDQVLKAIAIFVASISWIFASTFLLFIVEPEMRPFPLLFEACAAFANLGLSCNVTPLLSQAGKVIIIASMFVGRIGSLTMLLALRKRGSKHLPELHYPEERILLG